MQDLKARTKCFALDVIRYLRKLPAETEFDVIKRQLIRSASSTAANYRSAQRAKSKLAFISKLGDAEEKADESQLWLEMLSDLASRTHAQLQRLHREAGELTAILTTSRKSARGKAA